VDFDYKVIRLDNNVKTPGSTEPIPLSHYACDVLQEWKRKSSPVDDYVFPSRVKRRQAHFNVKTAWQATLRRAGVTAFPIYNLRLLYSAKRSGTGRSRATRYAPYNPRNKTSPPVGIGRTGKASGGENQQAAVRKAGTVTFP